MKFHFYKEPTKTLTQVATKQILKLNQRSPTSRASHRYSEALQLFTQIHSSPSVRRTTTRSHRPSPPAPNCRDVAFGTQLHAHAIRTGLKAYPHVANTLLSLYAKAEDLTSVKWVFDGIENPGCLFVDHAVIGLYKIGACGLCL